MSEPNLDLLLTQARADYRQTAERLTSDDMAQYLRLQEMLADRKPYTVSGITPRHDVELSVYVPVEYWNARVWRYGRLARLYYAWMFLKLVWPLNHQIEVSG